MNILCSADLSSRTVYLCMALFNPLAAQALPTDGKTTQVSQASLQGGSRSSVQWSAPSAATYKIWLQIAASGTAINAKYRLYLKGNAVGNKPCTSKNTGYPCFEVTVNQAANRGKWLLLTQKIGNKTTDQWRFARGGYISVNAENVLPTQQVAVAAISFEDMALRVGIGTRYAGGIVF